ncbi:MAG: hypothetical protein NTZ86_00405 [Legionellales bacterium]|jgi:hypothetical protein|nr:hypothetical protein [Legionellales bacterium]NDH66769.1 hypothetical protein [Gammaproteobacteria bacterium]
MKKLVLSSILFTSLQTSYAYSSDVTLSNPLLAEAFSSVTVHQDSEREPWDIAAIHSVVRDSDLYKLLMTMNITVPSMVKPAEYVLMYNEAHRMNQNLESILQELQKINEKLS